MLAVKWNRRNASHNGIQNSDLPTDNNFCTNSESMHVFLYCSDPDTNWYDCSTTTGLNVPMTNIFKHKEQFNSRGKTRKMLERTRYKMLGRPLLIAPANALCSNGDNRYWMTPRTLASSPKCFPIVLLPNGENKDMLDSSVSQPM